jgi:CubicO group peptidase (beta-lactamase class C family)
VRKFGVLIIGALIGVTAFARQGSAQILTFSVFRDNLEALRAEAGIPAISAVIVQNGAVVWTQGFGQQDVEGRIPARPDTPYVVGSLQQALGSTLYLRKCVDFSYAEVTDPVVRWSPTYQEPETTVGDLLSHTTPEGLFQYSASRQLALTGVIEECGHGRYPQLMSQEIFDLASMMNSVPGQTLGSPTPDEAALFDQAHLSRYAAALSKLAVPYRVISRRAVRNTDLVPSRLTFVQGVVSSALDLANFDISFDSGFLLSAEARARALSQTFARGRPLPTGLGWFVQAYNNTELVAWQFGVVDGGYSSLILKVPNRKLTLILLANSDGLSAPFTLEAGDVTTSIFAKTFLRTFVP